MNPRPSGANGHKRWPIVAVFGVIVALQLVVAALSIDVLSAVRAYVNGESLYSKGQKDAHIHLLGYLERRGGDDYAAFERALSVPLGDRVAREALQRPKPDVEAARRGFAAGANHADDIDGMVRLFLRFHDLPFMARAIGTWTEADELIERVHELAAQALRQSSDGRAAPALVAIGQQVRDLNGRLSALEARFSEQLGDASRQTQTLLIGLNIGLAGLAVADRLRVRAPQCAPAGAHRRHSATSRGVVAAAARFGGRGAVRRGRAGALHVHQSCGRCRCSAMRASPTCSGATATS